MATMLVKGVMAWLASGRAMLAVSRLGSILAKVLTVATATTWPLRAAISWMLLSTKGKVASSLTSTKQVCLWSTKASGPCLSSPVA